MAEFCIDCWNKLNNTNHTVKDYYISKHLELCEGCAEYKRVIIMPKERIDYFIGISSFFNKNKKDR